MVGALGEDLLEGDEVAHIQRVLVDRAVDVVVTWGLEGRETITIPVITWMIFI